MFYTSIENKKIKDIKKYNDKKYRDINSKFLVEGEHLVKEAYNSGLLETLIIENNVDFKLDVETIFVNDSVLKYISNLSNPSKIMGICNKKPEEEVTGNVLILDGIQDPGNLGTIIRSCVAFNINTIILGENCVDVYNSKVIRATQGMLFDINILRGNLKDIIVKLKNRNYKIYGTKVDNGINLSEVSKSTSFALIMGSEGLGVSSEILSLCDDYVYIKMNEKCESLNVGVATSIILYELSK